MSATTKLKKAQIIAIRRMYNQDPFRTEEEKEEARAKVEEETGEDTTMFAFRNRWTECNTRGSICRLAREEFRRVMALPENEQDAAKAAYREAAEAAAILLLLSA